MWEYIISPIIGVLCGAISTYVIAKRMINTDRIVDYAYAILDETMENVEMQKRVYGFGVLLGNGIKNGVGLSSKGGKFKFEDLIMQGIASFILPRTKEKQEEGLGIFATPTS